MDRRALPAIEHPGLEKSCVRRPAHLAAQGVHLPHQMALGRAADGGIAGHIAHRVQVDGEDGGGAAQPRRRQSGLDPRVACADYRNVIGFIQKFHAPLPHSCPKSGKVCPV